MKYHDDHVYVLSTTDVVRIRDLLSMYRGAIDRIFERSETLTNPDPEEFMADWEFLEKSGAELEVESVFAARQLPAQK